MNRHHIHRVGVAAAAAGMPDLTFFPTEVEGLGSAARTCLEACFLAPSSRRRAPGHQRSMMSVSGPTVLLDAGLQHSGAPCDAAERSTY
jgi:hypothetical protein